MSDSHYALGPLLRDVSRSFYLTLRVLPGKVRAPIGLAYLLARTTDTIADTELIPAPQRLQALAALRARILGRTEQALNFGELARCQASPAERVLLERVETALALLGRTHPDDGALIRKVLDVITGGQELDLQRFADASAQNVIALQKDADLDDYTYRVAGCVGEFWTRICRRHLFPATPLDEASLMADGVRFGKGLQLVNVLRDLPADLRQGRCYLPLETLATCGLEPRSLLDPAAEPRLRPGYDAWLARAEDHLRAGWRYTNILPRSCVRVRLACAWPLLIGFETLQLLRTGSVLDPGKRLKISRGRVRQLIIKSVFWYPFKGSWSSMAATDAGSTLVGKSGSQNN